MRIVRRWLHLASSARVTHPITRTGALLLVLLSATPSRGSVAPVLSRAILQVERCEERSSRFLLGGETLNDPPTARLCANGSDRLRVAVRVLEAGKPVAGATVTFELVTAPRACANEADLKKVLERRGSLSPGDPTIGEILKARLAFEWTDLAGSLAPTSKTTDADGFASTYYTAGITTGLEIDGDGDIGPSKMVSDKIRASVGGAAPVDLVHVTLGSLSFKRFDDSLCRVLQLRRATSGAIVAQAYGARELIDELNYLDCALFTDPAWPKTADGKTATRRVVIEDLSAEHGGMLPPYVGHQRGMTASFCVVAKDDADPAVPDTGCRLDSCPPCASPFSCIAGTNYDRCLTMVVMNHLAARGARVTTSDPCATFGQSIPSSPPLETVVLQDPRHFNRFQASWLSALDWGVEVTSDLGIVPAKDVATFSAPFLNSPLLVAFKCSRPFDPANDHYGLDAAVPEGTQVVASAGGTVIRASTHSQFGNLVVVHHGRSAGRHMYTLYAHLKSFENGIAPGVSVAQGDKLGLSGKTGVVTGAHLHFEVLSSLYPLAINQTGPTGIDSKCLRMDPYELIVGLDRSCGR